MGKSQNTFSFTRIDHVQLAMPIGMEETARGFFVGMLRFEEIAKPEILAKRGGAWFKSGPVAIHLGVDPDFRPAKKAHPALRCANYEALLDRLSQLGVSVIHDDIPFEGCRHCYIADPFGNRIEIIAEPGNR